jgi:glutathione S-transferase
LADRQYVLGDAFTIVDCTLASLVPFCARLGVDTTPFASLGAWVGRAMARPALARVMSA